MKSLGMNIAGGKNHFHFSLISLLLFTAFLLASCGGGTSNTPSASTGTGAGAATASTGTGAAVSTGTGTVATNTGTGTGTGTGASTGTGAAIANPPHSFADIAGTWMITAPAGNSGTFDVGDDGKISNLRLLVSISTSCAGYSDSYTGGCGTSSQKLDLTFGSIATKSDFTFSGDASATYQDLNAKGTFISSSLINGAYSGSYHHTVASSAGGFQTQGSGSGSWTAVPTGAPGMPKGVTATAGNKQVTLSWTAVTGATSYNVYYGTSSGVTTANGTKIAGAASPKTITGLANGTHYYFVVTAKNGGGESSISTKVSATPSTYTDNGNGTITDSVTGLMWQQQDDSVRRTWDDATTYCSGLALGDHSDWRLPTKDEALSILDTSQSPAINMTYFTITHLKYDVTSWNREGTCCDLDYWSSTVSAVNHAPLLVDFFNGASRTWGHFDNQYALCVRP